MHRSLLCAAALACACASSPSPSTPEVVVVVPVSPPPPGVAPGGRGRSAASLLGHWTGTGRQSDGPTWPMQLDVTSLERGECATATYPSLRCKAEWECLESSDGRSMRAVEHIVEGVERCIDGGSMTLDLSDDGTSIGWHWKDDRSEITARARLQRGGASPPEEPKPR